MYHSVNIHIQPNREVSIKAATVVHDSWSMVNVHYIGKHTTTMFTTDF